MKKVLFTHQFDMKHSRMKTIAALSLLVFSLCLISCRKNATPDLIRIGILEGPSAVSFVRMMDKEQFIDGKKVELVVRSEPLQIQAMMIKNEVDFAILPTVMAANLYNKGVKYRLIACPIWGTLYLLSNDGIQDMKDLNGSEIAVFGQGSTADVLLKSLIKREILDCKGIDYRFNTNQETAQALLSGEITAAVVSEPLVSILLAENPGIRIVSKLNHRGTFMSDSLKNNFIQSAFVVSEKFIDRHSQLIPEVCSAYMNSCNFINENPQAAADLMVKYKMAPNKAIALKSIDLCNIQYVAAFAFVRELNHYLHIYYTENPEAIGGEIPETDFIY